MGDEDAVLRYDSFAEIASAVLRAAEPGDGAGRDR
jgi:hypothetical protein